MSEMLHQQAPIGASPGRLPHWVMNAPFVLLHLALVAVFFVPVTWPAVLLCAFNYFWRMFGITAVYHRYFSHRSYKTSRVFQFLLAWLACSSLQKGPLWWAGHHRIHHRYSDTPQDPHSPHETSFWWSHVGWILSQEHEATTEAVNQEYSRYPELHWLDRWHWAPGEDGAIQRPAKRAGYRAMLDNHYFGRRREGRPRCTLGGRGHVV
jgi:stearoyl-CoA desaturase (Delta-9 desaturase)